MTVASEQPAPMDPILSGTRPQLAAGMRPRPRLDYLDGVRGCAALYVVLYHAFGSVILNQSQYSALAPWLRYLLSYLQYGHYAVAVFIALSGYCLMLPVLHQRDRTLALSAFFKRRALRILPPYYLALIAALALEWAVPALRSRHNPWGLMTQPAFNAPVLLSHLLLVHNLSHQWIYKIDSPMWSVATEWQIYILFALLLLPIWRRWGSGPTIVVAFVVGLTPHFISYQRFDLINAQYLGVFAMGMAAAVFEPGTLTPRRRRVWIAAGCLLTLIMIGVFSQTVFWTTHTWLMDVAFIGPVMMSLLIVCTHDRRTAPPLRNPLLRLFGSRPAVGLGRFSYSLYLMHAPCLALVLLWGQAHHLPLRQQVWLLLLGGTTLALGGCYGFYLAFERPFVRYREGQRAVRLPRTPREGEETAAAALQMSER